MMRPPIKGNPNPGSKPNRSGGLLEISDVQTQMKSLNLFLMLSCVLLAGCTATKAVSKPEKIFDVREFGAKGDGQALDTAAIQKAIDTASESGGGTVLVPEGKFLITPITLKSDVNLHLVKDATLLVSDDLANYPTEAKGRRYVDSITAADAHDIAITGAGTIDGQGGAWWTMFRTNQNMTHRPYLIKFSDCQRVHLSGVTLQNSPMFHFVPQNCTDVTIEGVFIHSPANAPNTDGIDPSGWNFLISHCLIDTGDDNIAIKPATAREPGNKNFLIRNCEFLHGHGLSIGSGANGGLENLVVTNCVFYATDAGIRIKTPRGRGGVVQNLTYENIQMTAVKNPIYIIDWYPERNAPKDPSTETAEPITDTTPIIRNIVIQNLTATNCPTAGIIRGLPEAPISNLTLSNVTISATSGMKIYHAQNVRFENSSLTVTRGDKLTTYNATISGLK